jgi:hypothetical protein
MNVPLKLAIVASGVSQRKVAWDAGLSESRLSDIVRGWSAPRDWERASLAHVLGRDESSIFSERRPE